MNLTPCASEQPWITQTQIPFVSHTALLFLTQKKKKKKKKKHTHTHTLLHEPQDGQLCVHKRGRKGTSSEINKKRFTVVLVFRLIQFHSGNFSHKVFALKPQQDETLWEMQLTAPHCTGHRAHTQSKQARGVGL